MDVFVYGTLTDPDRVASVVSTFEFRADATLNGLHRVDAAYPTLAPGGSVDGRVLRTPDVAALDAYEGVASGLYVRVPVPWAGEEGGDDDAGSESGEGDSHADRERDADDNHADRETVEVYVGDPDALGADVTWPGEGPFPERVRRFVRAEDVVVRAGDAGRE